MKHFFKHLGYFNEVGDVRAIGSKTADEIIDYYKRGYGNFHESKEHDADADACLESELTDGTFEDFIIDSTGQYIIHNEKRTWDDWDEQFKDNMDGDDAECYIDIYFLYAIEDNGILFYRN